jgi:mRNA interferase RelE/StbE
MKYRLVYTRRAEKDIKKLDPSVKRVIGKSLLKLQDNPAQYSEKLTDPRIGTYRFRIGDYRVIFDIEDKDVVILRVGHRRDIYRRC